ncbi:MAG: hydroxymethylglutaryl-CoA reductase, degradative [Desulfobulbaceae bacterium]|nr:hydroxymethylglutaryl-CoA reductase, degradative [Desulfobulbaceae bacterium]
MNDSRIKGLYRLGIAERIRVLQQQGWLSAADAELLQQGKHVLSPAAADKMIENVIGVFALPLAIAPNFVVNKRDYIVPMVVEEPSIVAATSNAARLARNTGGFTVECSESLLAGQIHVTDVDDPDLAMSRLNAASAELVETANAVHPRLVARGGGVREIVPRSLVLADGTADIAVHLLVDTCDAMGANLANTICEAVAARVAEICGGEISLAILSNLADRALVTATVRYQSTDIASSEMAGDLVRDRIVLASEIASADPHRAATHNKGIMNGIDAVAIATGNDWRAIEAGAHAFAAEAGAYKPLATWSVADNGDLQGDLRIPLKVGIVGATLKANPAAAAGIRITAVESAIELARLMAAVGLAQNFAALRALATTGIQEGHMRLHARGVAAAAEVPDECFDEVVGELIAGGDIKVQRARDLLSRRQSQSLRRDSGVVTAAGKVILLGEHAVVYGRHALALPIPDAVSARVTQRDAGVAISIPEWGVSQQVDPDSSSGIAAAVNLILRKLDISGPGFQIDLSSELPRAMGLGSSAAFAVAIVRAFDAELGLGLDDLKVNAIAFECEKFAHGTPSGVDNTIATYAQPMIFSNAGSLQVESLALLEPPPIIIACSSSPGLTVEQVAGVRTRYDLYPARYEALFDEIDALSQAGASALAKADYAELGMLMNICQGLLGAIEVSTAELEGMVQIARSAGASGAKLTGGGGGGSIVALCPGRVSEVGAALASAGFRTFSTERESGSE